MGRILRAGDLRCPTCGARPGSECVSLTRKTPCSKPHRQRVTAAERRNGPHLRPAPKRRPRRKQIPRAVRIAVRARSGDRCEAVFSLAPVSCRGSLHMHHLRRRGQGGPDTASNLLHVCGAHHDWIHSNPAQARALGLLRRGVGVAA